MASEKKDPDFPNIKARNEFDFEQHVKKAMEAGLTREEAERHAREDMAGHDEALIDPYVQEARKDKTPPKRRE